jgi:acylglycerol lipase
MIKDGYFKSADGLKFYNRHWTVPDTDRRAALVLLHGYGDHCARYDHVAEAFNQAGINVYSYDQRGHGKSPGKRGWIHDFNVLLDDLDHWLDHVRDELKPAPVFYMGHSMGGMVLARYAETRTFDARGLIFSSPFLAFPADVPAILLKLAGILGNCVPWLPVGGVDNTGLSRDPAVVEAADNDPLCYHGRVKARTGQQFQAAIEEAHREFDAITAPLYIIHGTADRIVDISGSRKLHEKASAEDKTFIPYEDGCHELWNDTNRDEVIAGIRGWMTQRMQ